MQIRIFIIPITDNGESQAEMNRFLAGHKVLEVEQYFFQNEKGACWSFCVRHLISNTGSFHQKTTKQKVDYKELLNENEFAANIFHLSENKNIDGLRWVTANHGSQPVSGRLEK